MHILFTLIRTILNILIYKIGVTDSIGFQDLWMFFSVHKYEMWVDHWGLGSSVKRSADCHSLCNQYWLLHGSRKMLKSDLPIFTTHRRKWVTAISEIIRVWVQWSCPPWKGRARSSFRLAASKVMVFPVEVSFPSSWASNRSKQNFSLSTRWCFPRWHFSCSVAYADWWMNKRIMEWMSARPIRVFQP